MLVLGRREEQAIVIELPDGTRGRVFLVEVTGSAAARLGFDFPRNVRIVREELMEDRR